MKSNLSFNFNRSAGSALPANGLLLAIRTDARHATAGLKENLSKQLKDRADRPDIPDLDRKIEKAVHEAYRDWGHEILQALADCIDYESYGLTAAADRRITVDFHDARRLSEGAAMNAGIFLNEDEQTLGLPLVRVSLDDMIGIESGHWGEIGFSRLFALEDGQARGFMPRPGKKPLAEQMKDLRGMLGRLKSVYNADIPFVLIEDNVRNARMINWVIGLMEENGVFDHGRLAGISTCFCCAPPEERARIVHRGQPVPVAAVVDYSGAAADVVTPRDLLFDGFVVKLEDKTARMPGTFMQAQKVFRISPEKEGEFTARAAQAHMAFCAAIESRLGLSVPLAWFSGADAIAHVTGAAPHEPMAQVLKRLPQAQNPKPRCP